MLSPLISIIVPVFNEAESLPLLCKEIVGVMGTRSFEVIVVDDGSTDATARVITELCTSDTRILGFRMNKNTGKGGALSVGMQHARGDPLITIDGDLQNDPKDIPLLLAALAGGADVALGWRQERADTSGKRWASALFNTLCSFTFGKKLHDANTGFKALRRRAAGSLPISGSLFRFLPHLLAKKGWSVVEVPVHHHPRKFGQTKFSLSHRLRGLPDLLLALTVARSGIETVLPPYQRLSPKVSPLPERSGMIRA
ncbi:MAG: glycosyltransferase family 2 protein [Candidatus Peribacteraceae bacterium]|nr:glycosyltransferase family 2 protein [Candidatus Peribacteraceae bacterium]